MSVKLKRYVTATVDVYTQDDEEELIGSIIRVPPGYGYRHKSKRLLSLETLRQIAYEIEFLQGLESDV